MGKHAWHVGQKVVVVEYRGRDNEVSDSEITKIGRKWITVGIGWREQRFDFEGRGDRDFGHRPTLWPDRAAYEAHVHLRARWSALRATVSASHLPPAHLTVEQIDTIISALTGDPA